MRRITLGVIFVTVLMVGAVLVVSRSDAAPPSKWKAVILPSANLSGDPARYQSALGGEVYDDAESNVDVYATIGSMGGGPYWTVFRARVYFPEKIYIDGVVPTSIQLDETPGLVYDGYPPDGTTQMFDFLNGLHPYDQSYTIGISFCGPYVSSRAEAEWESKPVGWTVQGRAVIEIQHDSIGGDCYACPVTNYHDILLQSHDAWLVKETATTYAVTVNTNFNNPDYAIGPAPWMGSGKDYILNRYCRCDPRISKKGTYYVKTYYFPELGSAPMAFQLKYVKY